ncbi:uncharacterized protein LOC116850702 [Odontomachus brunneus]|uniref:uncharacterized protein LOC116850702 n=1 Tax=Odontomachus brunneus TaxID=486640 RepID=UPI0013F21486|nr:uncharacterized protein LOC116850702 [Odontomachus brunneus]
MPTHTFPKDLERRNKWFHNLHMKPPCEESEIKKLRVCYKHFCEDNYSDSSSRRILLHYAIPSVNLPHQELSSQEQHEQNIPKSHTEQNKEQHEDAEALSHNESILLQQEKQQITLNEQQVKLRQGNCT